MVSKSDMKLIAMVALIGGGAYFAFTSWDPNRQKIGMLGLGAGLGIAVAPHL